MLWIDTMRCLQNMRVLQALRETWWHMRCVQEAAGEGGSEEVKGTTFVGQKELRSILF